MKRLSFLEPLVFFEFQKELEEHRLARLKCFNDLFSKSYHQKHCNSCKINFLVGHVSTFKEALHYVMTIKSIKQL